MVMYTDSKDKAEILDAQFKSVFTKLKKSITPSISGNKYSAIGKLNISLNGVTKLLQNINASKARIYSDNHFFQKQFLTRTASRLA